MQEAWGRWRIEQARVIWTPRLAISGRQMSDDIGVARNKCWRSHWRGSRVVVQIPLKDTIDLNIADTTDEKRNTQMVVKETG